MEDLNLWCCVYCIHSIYRHADCNVNFMYVVYPAVCNLLTGKNLERGSLESRLTELTVQ